MYFFLYFFVFFSVFFCCLCFLEKEIMMSSLYLTLATLSFCPLISLGFHNWYSYFVVLVFLSGVLSLLVYLCSIMDFNYSFSFFIFNFFFSFFWSLFFFDFLFYGYYFIFDSDFYVIFMDFNYYYLFWVVFVLFLFLNFISYYLSMKGCLRSFCILNSFSMFDYGSNWFKCFGNSLMKILNFGLSDFFSIFL